jgi:hypothetical protein
VLVGQRQRFLAVRRGGDEVDPGQQAEQRAEAFARS